MDPEFINHIPELLKGGAEIIKTGAEIAGAFKFTDIIKAFLGPATGEIAERFKDSARLYRFGRQLECLKKAEKMAKDAGFTPKAVAIKILFPLLEGASLEEDEDLHTMWAALLANASSPTNGERVRPNFIPLLKQLHPFEVLILERLYEDHQTPVTNENEFRRYGVDESELPQQPAQSGLTEKLQVMIDLHLSLDTVIAEQLVQKTFWQAAKDGIYSEADPPNRDEFGYFKTADFTYTLTTRGLAFVEACRPPKPQS